MEITSASQGRRLSRRGTHSPSHKIIIKKSVNGWISPSNFSPYNESRNHRVMAWMSTEHATLGGQHVGKWVLCETKSSNLIFVWLKVNLATQRKQMEDKTVEVQIGKKMELWEKKSSNLICKQRWYNLVVVYYIVSAICISSRIKSNKLNRWHQN